MSSSTVGSGVAACLLDEGARREAFLQLKRECGQNVEACREVERVVGELSSEDAGGLSKRLARVRQGIGWWALGEPRQAVEALTDAPSSPDRDYFLGLSCLEAGLPAQALHALEPLLEKEGGSEDVALAAANAKTALGRAEEALAELEALAENVGREPEYHFALGYALEHIGRSEEAVAEYEQALELDSDHATSLFRLAAHYAFVDETDRALDYYERLGSTRPFYPNAQINLGVLYEDLGKVDKAIECYRAALESRPRDWRARLYLKDAEGTLNMYYDEGVSRRLSQQWEVLRRPLSDFELSGHTRSCLETMGIQTLGDLVAKTEEELAGHKGFGDTSLLEVKQLMLEKGFSLGQEVVPPSPQLPLAEALRVTDTSYQEDVLRCPVTELSLSLRCQACMDRLGIVTVQDLVSKTAEELLAARNFGKVSLMEVEEKLSAHGLALKAPQES